MAIRFQCPSCQQPIEIDDEWGGKAVACPYCRSVVTAPAQSTLDVVSADPRTGAYPLARTAGSQPGASAFQPWTVGPPPAAPSAPIPSRRGWAITALTLAVLSLACNVGALITFAPHKKELMDVQNPMRPYMENVQTMMDYMNQTYGGMPGWYITAVLFWLGGGAAWAVAVTCGIVGVRSPASRRTASISLVLCGLTPLLCCCGPALL